MSTLELENIKHPDNSGNNLELAADGSIGSLNLSGNMGIGTNTPLTSPAGAFSWANPIATIEGSRPTLYLNSSGSLATIRMWPSGTDGSSTTLDDFHINAIATSGSTPGSLAFAAQGGAIGTGLSINSNNIVTTPDQPSFYVYASGGGTASSNSYTTPGFDNVSHNIGNHWDTSTVTFTAPVAGLYYFHFAMYWNSTNGYSRLRILKNSSTIHHYNIKPGLSSDHSQEVSGIIGMAANDTVKPQMQSDQSNNYFRAQNHTYFEGYLLG